MNFKDVEDIFSVSRKIKEKKLKQIQEEDLGEERRQQKVPNEMIENIEKLYDNLENSNILLEQTFNQIADRIEGGLLSDEEEDGEWGRTLGIVSDDEDEGYKTPEKEVFRIITSGKKRREKRRKKREEDKDKREEAEEARVLISDEEEERNLTQETLDNFFEISQRPFKLRTNGVPNKITSQEFSDYLKANKLKIPKGFSSKEREFFVAQPPLGERGYVVPKNKRAEIRSSETSSEEEDEEEYKKFLEKTKAPRKDERFNTERDTTRVIGEEPEEEPEEEEEEEDEEYKEYKDLTLKILRSIPNLGQLIKNIPSELNYYNSIVKAISVLQVALSLVKKIDFSLIPSEKGKILQIFRENLGSKELLESLITDERIIDTDMTFKKLYDKLIVVLNQINNLLN